MKQQASVNYQLIAKAIAFIQKNATAQPNADAIADHVNLSPLQFQQLFINWAGVDAPQFIQFISKQHANITLGNAEATLFDTVGRRGLASTGRVHALFVKVLPMSLELCKNKCENLTINYAIESTLFGDILVASTTIGICYMGFSDDEQTALADLKKRFQNAIFTQQTDKLQQNALKIFTTDWSALATIKLHLKGTEFQLAVWDALLKIPTGDLTTYGCLAQTIGKPRAARAVGTAIGNNPIAFLIPCHRVIQSSGAFGDYMWGPTRKTALIGWEAASVVG